VRVSDAGAEKVGRWFSNIHPSFTESTRLVMALGHDNAEQNFANNAQLLLLTSTSIRCLAELLSMEWLEVMKRFRPNIVIDVDDSGFAPLEEETIEEIWISGICFEVNKRLIRDNIHISVLTLMGILY